MKKTIGIGLITFAPLFAGAQAFFEPASLEYCFYDIESKSKEKCQWAEDNSLFELNESGTEIIHYAQDITSYYFVTSRSYDRSSGLLKLTVISDADNKYDFYVDEENKEIEVVFHEAEYKGLTLTFYLKRSY